MSTILLTAFGTTGDIEVRPVGPPVDISAMIAARPELMGLVLLLGLWSPAFGPGELPDVRATLCGFPRPDHGDLPAPVADSLGDGPPPIAVALGTSAVHVAAGLIERVAEACRLLGRRCLVMGTVELAPAPGLLIAPWAPYDQVLPRCAAVVHHAGAGTTAAVLRSGRPSLAVPFSHDQPDNSWRLTAHGVALSASRRASARTLARRLETVLAPPFPAAAAALGARVQAEEDGAWVLARHVMAAHGT